MLRLERQFGQHGVVLQWLGSYLSGRSYCVIFRDCMSSTVYIMCSVPQGSVVGPCLFILYTADLAAEDKKHDVDCRPTYIRWWHATISALSSQWHSIHCCATWTVPDVSCWMSANRHKLNAEKTELLWVGSRHGQTSLGCSVPSLHLGADTVVPSDHVRVLGVTISSDLSLWEECLHDLCDVFFSGFVNSGVSYDH